MNVAGLLAAAERHLAAGRDAAAEKLFVEALERPHGTVRAIAGLGKIALRAGAVERAGELFGRGLALAPGNADLLVGLAGVHLAAERAEDAELCLRRALRLDPESSDAHCALALALLSRRDVEGARTHAARALDLAPESSDVAMTAANVELLRGRSEVAFRLFERAAALAPERADPLAGQGAALQSGGDIAGAARALERARLLEPDSPSILARLAECRVVLGELEDAQRLVRQAVAVAPADAGVRNAEGIVAMHSGRHAEALESLRLAMRHDPRNPAPLVNLALLMRRNGRMEPALAAARQAATLGAGGVPDASAGRLEFDSLCVMGRWSDAWRRLEEMQAGEEARRVGGDPDMAGTASLGSRVALIVDDLSASLHALRLIPRLAADGRRIRILCLPAYASFFRALPGVDAVDGRDAIDLSRDVETDESVVLLDVLPHLARATPADLAPPGFALGEPSPRVAGALTALNGSPVTGLWWDDEPGGPDPQALLNALPGTPALLREPDSGWAPVLADGRNPAILADRRVEDLLDLAQVLVSLDSVVCVDGAVAHLAANLGCRTLVLCRFDIPWYWQPCGPEGLRWYPTARAIARGCDGLWSHLAEACDDQPAGGEERAGNAAAAHV